MKKFKSLLAIVALMAGMFVMNACDDCKDVTCLNGGTCVAGVCECATGYEGDDCGTAANAKFLGVYTVTDGCLSSSYAQTVSAGSAANKVTFNNLGNYVTPAIVSCDVEGTSISVTNFEDSTGRKFTVNGSVSGQNINLTYTVTYTDLTTETCTCSFVRND